MNLRSFHLFFWWFSCRWKLRMRLSCWFSVQLCHLTKRWSWTPTLMKTSLKSLNPDLIKTSCDWFCCCAEEFLSFILISNKEMHLKQWWLVSWQLWLIYWTITGNVTPPFLLQKSFRNHLIKTLHIWDAEFSSIVINIRRKQHVDSSLKPWRRRNRCLLKFTVLQFLLKNSYLNINTKLNTCGLHQVQS